MTEEKNTVPGWQLKISETQWALTSNDGQTTITPIGGLNFKDGAEAVAILTDAFLTARVEPPSGPALEPRPDPAPDAWQYRCRAVGKTASEWTKWMEGRAPDFHSTAFETEERPLYASPPAPAVRVKPLEWRNPCQGMWDTWTGFGFYVITSHGKEFNDGPFYLKTPEGHRLRFDTIAEAKNMAQKAVAYIVTKHVEADDPSPFLKNREKK